MNKVLSKRRRENYLKILGVNLPTSNYSLIDSIIIRQKPSIEYFWKHLYGMNLDFEKSDFYNLSTNKILSFGDLSSDWLIVSEVPRKIEGTEEAIEYKNSKLLSQMLKAIHLNEQSIFFSNLLRFGESNDSKLKTEKEDYRIDLYDQIDLIKPKIILAFGTFAAQVLTNSEESLSVIRKKKLYLNDISLPIIVTYHPNYLLNNPEDKEKAWQDLLLASKLFKENKNDLS